MNFQSSNPPSGKTTTLHVAASNMQDWAAKDDGFKLENCGYAIVLLMSYVMLSLAIGSATFR